MKTSSAKSKGRRLQQWVRDQLLETFPSLTQYDVRSTSMGAGGVDVQLSTAALRLFPFAVECKNVENLNVWKAFEQAESNTNGYEALLVMKKNGKAPLVVVDAEYFFENLVKPNQPLSG
jgi:hypothetical protein